MRTVLVLLAVAITALSGCTDPADTTDGDGTGTGTGTGTQTGTGDPGTGNGGGGQDNGTNQAPTADLTADITNGTAPLNVTFRLDGADPDGDNLTWSLESNGTELANGTALPANVTHLFGAGSFNVTLRVSDGQANATNNVTVEVVAGAVQAPEDQTFTGSITGVWEPLGGYSHDPVDHTYLLPSQPATMTVHLKWARTGGALDLDFYVYDPAGTEVAVSDNYNDPVQGDNKQEELLVIDDAAVLSRLGEWTFSVLSAGSVDADYTLTVSFT